MPDKNKASPVINIFTYRLPKYLAQPIYTEFKNRYSESIRIIENYKKYSTLKRNLETVELLLALSIFHNHIIANLDAATKFYGLVIGGQQAESIRIGSYNLNAEEIRRIQSIMIYYNTLMQKYGLNDMLWNYNLTLDFLQRLINIKRKGNE